MRSAVAVGPLFPLAVFARAEGISERVAREVLHRGVPGFILFVDTVLPLTQHGAERLVRAQGVDPYPELIDDQRDAARDRSEQDRATAKADEAGAKQYAAMCSARQDWGTVVPVVYK